MSKHVPHPRETTDAPLQGWSLRLLGRPELTGPQGPVRLDRNQQTALAFLAQGAAPTRRELAALLWPLSPDVAANANLRQMLRRLRMACGGVELMQRLDREAPVALAAGLQIDLWHLRDAALGLRPAGPLLAHYAEVLEGVALEGPPEATSWLEATRLEAEGWFRRLCVREVQRLQEVGDLDGALTAAEHWVRAEPTSEPAARALMQLHAWQGNRTAALAAYERLKRALAEGVAASPSPETVALLQRIRTAGVGVRPPVQAEVVRLPTSLQRPPRLVGRAAEWGQLEEAWQQGQVVLLRGARGLGRTRLALDFAASKGECLRVCCQVGEQQVPYASALRVLRQLREERPATRLPAWVRRALVRLTRGEGAPAAHLPTYEALTAAFCASTEGLHTLVVDGLEHCDAASAAFLCYLLGERPSPGGGEPVRVLLVARDEEGDGPVREVLARLQAEGRAREVCLQPLPREAMRELATSLALPGELGVRAEEVARAVGGSPLLLLKTLREVALRPTAFVQERTSVRRTPAGREVLPAHTARALLRTARRLQVAV